MHEYGKYVHVFKVCTCTCNGLVSSLLTLRYYLQTYLHKTGLYPIPAKKQLYILSSTFGTTYMVTV